MLIIQGALSIVPMGVSIDAGELKVQEDAPSQPAVIVTFTTHSGPVQVAIPSANVDGLVKGLQENKKVAEEKTPKSELYVAGSMAGVEDLAKAQQELFGAEDG